MASKYDIEGFFVDLKAVLQANLNTKLAEIDTDYSGDGLGITLKTIPSGAYFFQSMAEHMANYDVFVYYGVDNITGNGDPYGHVDKSFSADVVIMVSDSGNDPYIMNRLLRYHRALIEIFETNFASVSKLGKIKVQSLSPFPAEIINRPTLSRGIGVTLEVHIP